MLVSGWKGVDSPQRRDRLQGICSAMRRKRGPGETRAGHVLTDASTGTTGAGHRGRPDLHRHGRGGFTYTVRVLTLGGGDLPRVLASTSAFVVAALFHLQYERTNRLDDFLVALAFGATAILEGTLPLVREIWPGTSTVTLWSTFTLRGSVCADVPRGVAPAPRDSPAQTALHAGNDGGDDRRAHRPHHDRPPVDVGARRLRGVGPGQRGSWASRACWRSGWPAVSYCSSPCAASTDGRAARTTKCCTGSRRGRSCSAWRASTTSCSPRCAPTGSRRVTCCASRPRSC